MMKSLFKNLLLGVFLLGIVTVNTHSASNEYHDLASQEIETNFNQGFQCETQFSQISYTNDSFDIEQNSFLRPVTRQEEIARPTVEADTNLWCSCFYEDDPQYYINLQSGDVPGRRACLCSQECGGRDLSFGVDGNICTCYYLTVCDDDSRERYFDSRSRYTEPVGLCKNLFCLAWSVMLFPMDLVCRLSCFPFQSSLNCCEVPMARADVCLNPNRREPRFGFYRVDACCLECSNEWKLSELSLIKQDVMKRKHTNDIEQRAQRDAEEKARNDVSRWIRDAKPVYSDRYDWEGQYREWMIRNHSETPYYEVTSYESRVLHEEYRSRKQYKESFVSRQPESTPLLRQRQETFRVSVSTPPIAQALGVSTMFVGGSVDIPDTPDNRSRIKRSFCLVHSYTGDQSVLHALRSY